MDISFHVTTGWTSLCEKSSVLQGMETSFGDFPSVISEGPRLSISGSRTKSLIWLKRKSCNRDNREDKCLVREWEEEVEEEEEMEGEAEEDKEEVLTSRVDRDHLRKDTLTTRSDLFASLFRIHTLTCVAGKQSLACNKANIPWKGGVYFSCCCHCHLHLLRRWLNYHSLCVIILLLVV